MSNPIELINNCKNGSRQAQEQLYRDYSRILFGICLKYSRNKTEAEDSLHDSFMTIYSKIDQFKHQGSFEGWMKRITINTVLQKYRKQESLSLVSDNIQEEAIEEAEYVDVDLQVLLRYIQELPDKYRLTFNLYVLDGYSHKEISEMLGTSEGTSKSNLARARKILKEKIEANKARIHVEG
ncbi:RNA polymerase sigma factor [Arenibacter certesii]|uniref:DNA-directed RNA polymerase sigma-70 factor n=1 Tax=Arenibacter certesii TaxID=228955 RepID=A0A918MLP9_9FLAO|nr:sigma-70 family RNA polymerase sigma factor [Arenibacter certesii]GGW38580.1 DNA-directed RNA polymerase sigma-70 factor [Arenibacter certesii]